VAHELKPLPRRWAAGVVSLSPDLALPAAGSWRTFRLRAGIAAVRFFKPCRPTSGGSSPRASAGLLLLYFLGKRLAARPAAAAAQALHEARALHDAAARKVDASFAQEGERIQLTQVSTMQIAQQSVETMQAETRSLRAGLDRFGSVNRGAN